MTDHPASLVATGQRFQSPWRLLSIFTITVLAGCAALPERDPVPSVLSSSAEIPGVPDARFENEGWSVFTTHQLEEASEEELKQNYPAIFGQAHNYLAISGGGADGAFGAGLITGWSEAGTRPEFTMVTGVSTGALMAPFVFLGPEYDEQIRRLYTTTDTDEIADMSNMVASARRGSVADSSPLRDLIARSVTVDMIRAIGAEHRRGRRLFLGTVNLDTGRSVIWNIGAIARSDYPRRFDLIHDVMLASASIPVAFPPVLIPVEADGASYEEMHVDGGTGSQVFVYPAAVDWSSVKESLRVQGQPRVYVIRNSLLYPRYEPIDKKLIPIASRTIDSLIRTQGIGDLYEIYALCQRDGNDFNLAYIPSDFTAEPVEGFDPVYMSELFDLGHELARQGYPWVKGPPGFEADP